MLSFGVPDMKLLRAFSFIVLLNVAAFGQFDPDDIDRLRQFLHLPERISITVATSDRIALEDEPLRAALKVKGFDRAKQFSWEQAATKTVALYGELCHVSR